LGDPTKAKQKLGWTPEITFEQMVKEMIKSDLKDAQKDHLCQTHGFNTFEYNE
jgi:GDPmannose 4,6-dehydratase